MFRGFTKSEHNLVLILVFGLLAGVSFLSLSGRASSQISISGPVQQISASELDRPESPDTRAFGGAISDGLIDINKATASLLEELPGIGPSKAGAIISYRERHGSFLSVSQLTEVPGIGDKTLQNLIPLITVSAPTEPAQTLESLAPSIVEEELAPQDEGITSAPPAVEPLINLNSATVQELQGLDGIGPTLAKRTVEDREANGSFRTVQEWTRVNGIGAKTLEQNRHRLTIR